jgi:superfamily II DNA or RNA helicase
MIKIILDKNKNKGVYIGDYFNETRTHFSVKNDAAKFAARFGRGFFPNRLYAITPTGRFDPCLYFEIQKFLKDYYNEEKLDVGLDFFETVLPGRFNQKYKEIKELCSLNLELRDYQEDTVKKCISCGRGVVVLATGGGKTLIIASLIGTLHQNKAFKKGLIIVPNLGLVEQTYNDFKDYNVKFTSSKWTGNDPLNLNADIIIANLGILQSKKTDLSFLEDIDLLIIDEVHTSRKGNQINKLIEKIKTNHKYGFTGTLPESPIDQWNIIGKIGPIIVEKSSYELRQKKVISPATALVLEINYKTKPPALGTQNKYKEELEFLFTNSYRNNILLNFTKKVQKNSLILVDYIKHGEQIYNVLKNNHKDKKVYFVRGSVEIEDRERIKKIMEYKDNVICIAISKIFSTGINIKNLHYIIFAGGGKAKIKILQSIGRGLRLHHSKQQLFIVDLADQLQYGIRHYRKRSEFYEQENIKTQKIAYQEK